MQDVSSIAECSSPDPAAQADEDEAHRPIALPFASLTTQHRRRTVATSPRSIATAAASLLARALLPPFDLASRLPSFPPLPLPSGLNLAVPASLPALWSYPLRSFPLPRLARLLTYLNLSFHPASSSCFPRCLRLGPSRTC